MTAYTPHSAAQLRRAQLNGAYKTANRPGIQVDHAPKIKSCLANGAKNTLEVAAYLGLGCATAYRRLAALADIGLITRSKGKGIRSVVWSLPESTTAAAGKPERPRRYVATFQPGGRSESEFYGHRDTAMEIRK